MLSYVCIQSVCTEQGCDCKERAGGEQEEARTGMKGLSQEIKINSPQTQSSSGIPSWALDIVSLGGGHFLGSLHLLPG